MTSQPVASKVAIPRLKRRDDDPKAPQPKERRKPERTCTVACNSCRKRKVRCTGQQPRCHNCAIEDLICIYTPDRQNRLRAATNENGQLLSFLKDLSADSRGAQKRKIDEFLNAIEGDGLATTSAGILEPDSNQASFTVSAITTSTGKPSGSVVPHSLPSITTLTRSLLQPNDPNELLVEGIHAGCKNQNQTCDCSFPNCSKCLASNVTSVDAVVPHSLINTARKRPHSELHLQSIDSERSRPYMQAPEVGQNWQSDDSVNDRSSSYSQAMLSPQDPTSSRHSLRRTLLKSKYDDPDYIFEELWQTPREAYGNNGTILYLTSSALPISRWTTVSTDEKLLNHLLLLFWTWDTMVNRVIDRTLFEDALKQMKPSDQVGLRFCSPFLVNALLALACLYTTQNATFYTPDDPVTRGAAFAREAERLLVLEQKNSSLPVAQGLAALYVYEGNLGKLPTLLRYSDYFYRAHERLQWDIWLYHSNELAGRHQDIRVKQGASRIQWGFYVYEWKSVHPYCRRKQIRKPRIPKLWQVKEMTSLYPSEDGADYWWFAYPLSLTAQVSMKVEIFDAECYLAEIVEEILEFLDPREGEAAPHENITRARDLYQRILDWKNSLPERLRAEDAVHPAAILLQANLDVVLISILSPFDATRESFFGSLDARSTSYYHASSIMSKLWTFRALYTLQHEFWNIQLCSLCAFRVLFDLDFGSLQVDTFTKACQGLYEMTERFPLARSVLASIQSAIELRGLQLPSFATRHLSNEAPTVGESIMKYTVVPVSLTKSTVGEAGPAGKHERLTLSELLMKLDLELGPD